MDKVAGIHNSTDIALKFTQVQYYQVLNLPEGIYPDAKGGEMEIEGKLKN